MINRLTIRQRILVIFILITFVGGTVQFLIAGRQLEAATLEFYQHHLETDALLVAATFAEPLGHYLEGEGEGGIGRMLATLQQEVKHDYLILDRNHRVVGYTANTGYEQMDRVPASPELIEADTSQIGSDIRSNHMGEAALYIAVSVRYEGQALGYLVLSEPMAPAYAEVNRRYMELAVATLPVIILVIAGIAVGVEYDFTSGAASPQFGAEHGAWRVGYAHSSLIAGRNRSAWRDAQFHGETARHTDENAANSAPVASTSCVVAPTPGNVAVIIPADSPATVTLTESPG